MIPLPLLLVLCGSQALAQGFDGQRFVPPTGAAGGLLVERATVPAVASVGLFLDYALNPVVLSQGGEVVARPLQSLFAVDLIGTVALVDRLELGVDVPLMPLYRGDRVEQPGFTYEAAPGLGDVRFVPKLAILGTAAQDGFRLGLAVPLSLPSGNEDALRGAGELSVEPRLLLGVRAAPVTLHASGGFRIRPGLDAADPVGNEVTYGLGVAIAAIPGEPGLDVLLEGAGAADVNRPGPQLTDHPIEVLGGVQWRPAPSWSVTAAAGPGLTDGLGTPDVRAVLGVRYAPRPADTYEPTANDTDGDRINNDKDACPDQPEDRDGFEDRDGCPDRDNDGDKVLDDDDECPNVAEPRGGDGDGCPEGGDVRLKADRIEFDGKIQFAFDSADIDPRSRRLLDKIAKVIRDHREIKRVVIQGNTDSVGSYRYNDDLSQRRADSVRAALIERGIDGGRLVTKGYGERRPVAPNDTPAGRASNRRVEFVLKE